MGYVESPLVCRLGGWIATGDPIDSRACRLVPVVEAREKSSGPIDAMAGSNSLSSSRFRASPKFAEGVPVTR